MQDGLSLKLKDLGTGQTAEWPMNLRQVHTLNVGLYEATLGFYSPDTGNPISITIKVKVLTETEFNSTFTHYEIGLALWTPATSQNNWTEVWANIATINGSYLMDSKSHYLPWIKSELGPARGLPEIATVTYDIIDSHNNGNMPVLWRGAYKNGEPVNVFQAEYISDGMYYLQATITTRSDKVIKLIAPLQFVTAMG
jgi:hypothetical protein